MTSSQFLAMWNIKALNGQAFQKYKDMDYMRRERILPTRTSNNPLIDDEYTWQNLLEKNEWYSQWESKVEYHLSSFREYGTGYLLKFQNVELGDWSDTVANRLEKQMIILEDLLEDARKKYGIGALWRTHYDPKSKCLYLLQLRNRESWKVKVVDFSKTGKPAQLLEEIYNAPLEHHDFSDLEFIVNNDNYSLEESDRSIYFTIKNINRKIDKEFRQDVGLLEVKNSQVWVDRLHI